MFLCFTSLLMFGCTYNSDSSLYKDTGDQKIETRNSGLYEDCKPNECDLCIPIDIEIDYTYDDCSPEVYLRVINHGGGSCPGTLEIDWGVGNGYQPIGSCLNMSCANLYTTAGGKTGIHYALYDFCFPTPCFSLPYGVCSKYLVNFKYTFDNTCSTCFGALAGNSDCNPLIICKKITVCNYRDSKVRPCIAI